MLTTVLPTLQLALSGSDDDLLSTDLDSAAGSLDDVRPPDDFGAGEFLGIWWGTLLQYTPQVLCYYLVAINCN